MAKTQGHKAGEVRTYKTPSGGVYEMKCVREAKKEAKPRKSTATAGKAGKKKPAAKGASGKKSQKPAQKKKPTAQLGLFK